MSIIDKKITSYNGKDVASADDVLTGSAAENKAIFDALTKEVVVPAFNDLIDELVVTESASHTHENKTVLDGITESVKTGYDNAVNEAHIHENESILDSITAELKNGYDTAYENMHIHNNKEVIDNITSSDINNYNSAVAEAHTHANKSTLDSLDSVLNEYATIDYVDDAISSGIGQVVIDSSLSDTSINPVQNKVITVALAEKASIITEHTHENKATLDTITASIKSSYDNAVEKAHSHENKVVLDEITNEVKSGYDTAAVNTHIHNNKAVLDSITEDNKTGYDSAAENVHMHTNKIVLDNITSNDINNYNSAVNASHTHANKNTLDSIDSILDDYATTEYVDNAIAAGGGQIVVDNALSITSINPVQNKVITEALSEKASSANEHTHGNKSVLDSISNEVKAGYDNSVTNMHTHANKATLDGINAEDISNYDVAVTNTHIHGNKTVLDGITESVKTGYDSAVTASHTHDNKAVLDSITAEDISNYDTAAEEAHTHNNKVVIDSIDSANIEGWNQGAQNSHTHTNKTLLDGITYIPKRTATLVIGTSTAGHTSADCDYLCTGTADYEKFNAAIAALPSSGGEIKVLEGTYQFTQGAPNANWIHCTKTNVKITGTGRSTIIRMVDSNSGVVSSGIRLSAVGCEISNMTIDYSGWVSTPGGGNPAVWLNANECKCREAYFIGYWDKFAIYCSAGQRQIVTGNTVYCTNTDSASHYKIHVSGSTHRSIICNNIVWASNAQIGNSGTGNVVANNVLYDSVT